MQTTELKEIKRVAKVLLKAVPIEPLEICSFLVNHPFTDSPLLPDKKGEFKDIVNDKVAYKEWTQTWEELIDKANDVIKIYAHIRDPWKLTFLKYAKNYLSKKDFSKLFADAWVMAENPNCDANCTLRELISWYKYADKKTLMTKEDYEVYIDLPDTLTIYRGVAKGREPKGLSWTQSIKRAEWFAHRFDREDEEGYVLTAEISKQNVLAYFNTRNEDEIVVDYFKIKNLVSRVENKEEDREER